MLQGRTIGSFDIERVECRLALRILIKYADCSFEKGPKESILVMGYSVFIEGALVFWSSKKQRTVSMSNTKD